MDISYGPGKARRNVLAHGVSFLQALAFEWSSAWIRRDERYDYGEARYRAMGYVVGGVETRLYVLVFTPRAGRVHVISMRKANSREVRRYEEAVRK